MHHSIFINLPVRDVGRSRAFFAALGYGFNEQFSDANALCMLLGPNLHAMLLAEPFFQTFTTRPVADAHRTTEVLVGLDCGSREQVDELVRKAVAAGGTAPRPAVDHGFMYQHGFVDLDGHVWELIHMNGPPA